MSSSRPRSACALALASLLAAGCRDRAPAAPPPSAAAPAPPAPTPAPTARPRLVVLIVIDQLPSWSFERDRALFTGGLARLLAAGVSFPFAEYPYANTYTATGHAALATGAPPRVSGILANRWFDRATGRAVEATTDPGHPELAIVPGAPVGDGQSGLRLLVPGIADSLRSATGGRGRSVAISLKERSAILMTGQQPDRAIWYSDRQPAMTTSTAYGAAPPAWLVRFGVEHPIGARLNEVWEPGDPVALARHSGVLDAAPGEGEAEGGLGTTFPHVPARAPAPALALLSTPMATDLIFDTAEAALAGEQLGADDVPDLLAISVSSHDYAGHAWGQESWERLDLLLRLDRRLGEFLDGLDRALGRDAYAVVLTSDHGGVPLVERARVEGHAAQRVPRGGLLDAAQRGAASVLGAGRWFVDYQANTIYASPELLARPEPQRVAALDAAAAAVARVPGVGLVAPSARLAGGCDVRRDLAERLACEAIAPALSGELWVAVADGNVATDATSGTGHGSPSRADRVVPIVVVGPGRAPRRDERPVSTLRVAPTLAALLGVPPPAFAHEPALE
jgi:hypothetical protein